MLDNIPMATIISIVSIPLIFLGYLNGDLSIESAFVSLGVISGGAGVLGIARAQSGKGMK